MRALMLPQALPVSEALSTLSTHVGSFSRVKPVVHLKFFCSGVAFAADATNKRSVLNVGLVMCCKVRVYAKRLATDGACERSLPRMLHFVQLERGRRMEASAALEAEEGFLPRVDALVNLDVLLIDELLAAVGT